MESADLVKVHVQVLLEQLLNSLPQLGAALLHMLAPPHNDRQLARDGLAMLEALLQCL